MDPVILPPLWLSTALDRLWSLPDAWDAHYPMEARKRAAMVLRGIEAENIPAPTVGRNAAGFPSLRWSGERGREVLIVVYLDVLQCVTCDVATSAHSTIGCGDFETIRSLLAWLYPESNVGSESEMIALAERRQP